MIGKWHLGWDWQKSDGAIDFSQPVKNGPDINGFDQYYAHCGSLDMPPYVWVDSGRVTALPDRKVGVTRQQDRYGWYRRGPAAPDFQIEQVLPHLFDQAMHHVQQRAPAAEPFFLYLALPAPHTPIVPLPPFQGASGINPYADFVMQMDHHVGQLMTAIQESEENTLVIFTSDNGCSPVANFKLLQEHGHDPSAGYRGHKADIYEGGHRVPLVVRWPGRVAAGTTTDALACLTDLYPTLAEIAGVPPQEVGGEDGQSLLGVFAGEARSERTTLVSHSIRGHFAIREGDWKLCLAAGSGGWSAPREKIAQEQGLPPLQLFDLATDPGERNNLIDKHPEKVAALRALLQNEIDNGRSTPGKPLANDRPVQLPPLPQ
jgi:arylsulfatase A